MRNDNYNFTELSLVARNGLCLSKAWNLSFFFFGQCFSPVFLVSLFSIFLGRMPNCRIGRRFKQYLLCFVCMYVCVCIDSHCSHVPLICIYPMSFKMQSIILPFYSFALYSGKTNKCCRTNWKRATGQESKWVGERERGRATNWTEEEEEEEKNNKIKQQKRFRSEYACVEERQCRHA